VALFAITGTVDLTGVGKGKRIASWHLSNTGVAATVNFRDGSVTGTRYIQVQLPANASASESYSMPNGAPLYPSGVYVEVLAGTILGSIDLI
jgi:hypothetical protein